MRKWRIVLALVMLALVGWASLLAWLTPPSPWERITKVRLGMTVAEVQAILGAPGKETDDRLLSGEDGDDRLSSGRGVFTIWGWDFSDCGITVGFDEDGKASDVIPVRPPPTPWERFVDFLSSLLPFGQ
jgi:hypothetical protein